MNRKKYLKQLKSHRRNSRAVRNLFERRDAKRISYDYINGRIDAISDLIKELEGQK